MKCCLLSLLLSGVSVGIYEALFYLPTPVRCQCRDIWSAVCSPYSCQVSVWGCMKHYLLSLLLSGVSVGIYEALFALPTPVRCQCGYIWSAVCSPYSCQCRDIWSAVCSPYSCQASVWGYMKRCLLSLLLSGVSVEIYEVLFALATPVRCQCGDVWRCHCNPFRQEHYPTRLVECV